MKLADQVVNMNQVQQLTVVSFLDFSFDFKHVFNGTTLFLALLM